MQAHKQRIRARQHRQPSKCRRLTVPSATRRPRSTQSSAEPVSPATPPLPMPAASRAAPTAAAPTALPTQAPHALDAAVKQLAKLPILGPALWLYAKDPEKKTLFLADTASQPKPARILPPVILEQCQLFTKGEIPFAFITWAWVNDEVDMRLRAGVAKIAPHEWKGGEHAWLIDVVSPFEKAEPYVKACCERFMAGRKVSRLVVGSESTRVEEVAGVAR